MRDVHGAFTDHSGDKCLSQSGTLLAEEADGEQLVKHIFLFAQTLNILKVSCIRLSRIFSPPGVFGDLSFPSSLSKRHSCDEISGSLRQGGLTLVLEVGRM